MPVEQIAGLLGIPAETVKRLQRHCPRTPGFFDDV